MYTEKSEFPCLNNDKKKANQEVRCQATVLSDSHDLSLAGERRGGGLREWREASRRQKGKKGGTIEN